MKYWVTRTFIKFVAKLLNKYFPVEKFVYTIHVSLEMLKLCALESENCNEKINCGH